METTHVSESPGHSLRADAEEIFRAAVDRVMPGRLFSYCLSLEGSVLRLWDGEEPQTYDLSKYDHVVIVAFGKASIPMTASLALQKGLWSLRPRKVDKVRGSLRISKVSLRPDRSLRSSQVTPFRIKDRCKPEAKC